MLRSLAGPFWHEKPVANLGGHTLIFEGRFDQPLLSAASHSTQTQILASQGRLDEAQAEARTAVEMAPQRMQAHLTLAQVLIRAKQFPQARVSIVKQSLPDGQPGCYETRWLPSRIWLRFRPVFTQQAVVDGRPCL